MGSRCVFSRHTRMADVSHVCAVFLLLQWGGCYSNSVVSPAAAWCNAADPCPSDRVFHCQLLWFSSISRSTSRGTNTYIPFCKVEGFKLLYPRRHRREGRSPRLYCLLVYCMLKQLVCFASCCMHANYNCKLLEGGGLRQVQGSTLDSSRHGTIRLSKIYM